MARGLSNIAEVSSLNYEDWASYSDQVVKSLSEKLKKNDDAVATQKDKYLEWIRAFYQRGEALKKENPNETRLAALLDSLKKIKDRLQPTEEDRILEQVSTDGPLTSVPNSERQVVPELNSREQCYFDLILRTMKIEASNLNFSVETNYGEAKRKLLAELKDEYDVCADKLDDKSQLSGFFVDFLALITSQPTETRQRDLYTVASYLDVQPLDVRQIDKDTYKLGKDIADLVNFNLDELEGYYAAATSLVLASYQFAADKLISDEYTYDSTDEAQKANIRAATYALVYGRTLYSPETSREYLKRLLSWVQEEGEGEQLVAKSIQRKVSRFLEKQKGENGNNSNRNSAFKYDDLLRAYAEVTGISSKKDIVSILESLLSNNANEADLKKLAKLAVLVAKSGNWSLTSDWSSFVNHHLTPEERNRVLSFKKERRSFSNHHTDLITLFTRNPELYEDDRLRSNNPAWLSSILGIFGQNSRVKPEQIGRRPSTVDSGFARLRRMTESGNERRKRRERRRQSKQQRVEAKQHLDHAKRLGFLESEFHRMEAIAKMIAEDLDPNIDEPNQIVGVKLLFWEVNPDPDRIPNDKLEAAMELVAPENKGIQDLLVNIIKEGRLSGYSYKPLIITVESDNKPGYQWTDDEDQDTQSEETPEQKRNDRIATFTLSYPAATILGRIYDRTDAQRNLVLRQFAELTGVRTHRGLIHLLDSLYYEWAQRRVTESDKQKVAKLALVVSQLTKLNLAPEWSKFVDELLKKDQQMVIESSLSLADSANLDEVYPELVALFTARSTEVVLEQPANLELSQQNIEQYKKIETELLAEKPITVKFGDIDVAGARIAQLTEAIVSLRLDFDVTSVILGAINKGRIFQKREQLKEQTIIIFSPKDRNSSKPTFIFNTPNHSVEAGSTFHLPEPVVTKMKEVLGKLRNGEGVTVAVVDIWPFGEEANGIVDTNLISTVLNQMNLIEIDMLVDPLKDAYKKLIEEVIEDPSKKDQSVTFIVEDANVGYKWEALEGLNDLEAFFQGMLEEIEAEIKKRNQIIVPNEALHPVALQAKLSSLSMLADHLTRIKNLAARYKNYPHISGMLAGVSTEVASRHRSMGYSLLSLAGGNIQIDLIESPTLTPAQSKQLFVPSKLRELMPGEYPEKTEEVGKPVAENPVAPKSRRNLV